MDFSKLRKNEYRYTGEEAKKYLDAKQSSEQATEESQVIDKPYKRGFFTGAFDPFHVAHAEAIENASSLCEQLIVGVSTDDVIRHYKGEPFQPFEQRLRTISYIKGVSLAIPQNDLYNKLEMLQDLGADVLFSCEEYQRSYYPDESQMTDKQRAGVERWENFEQEANAVGIDVVYLPRSQETSSSALKESFIARSGCQKPQGIMLYSEGECNDEPCFSL